jgi:ATP-dependent DNA helicase PIF1
MTLEQKNIYDTIMARVNNGNPGFFFLYGYGGTGKTYIWRALSAALRSKGEIVLTVASSGIAALLIPGGRTAHSRFSIPINIDEYSTCEIGPKDPSAELIRRAKLIIWDEAPMMHRHCFEAVDRTFKDIMKDKSNPFGGKVVVLGGDFRQILPVIPKGTRHEIVKATINSSPLWSQCQILTLTTNMRLLSGHTGAELEERHRFSEWILGIGEGSIGDADEDYIKVQMPHDLLIPATGDPMADIVKTTIQICYITCMILRSFAIEQSWHLRMQLWIQSMNTFLIVSQVTRRPTLAMILHALLTQASTAQMMCTRLNF